MSSSLRHGNCWDPGIQDPFLGSNSVKNININYHNIDIFHPLFSALSIHLSLALGHSWTKCRFSQSYNFNGGDLAGKMLILQPISGCNNHQLTITN